MAVGPDGTGIGGLFVIAIADTSEPTQFRATSAADGTFRIDSAANHRYAVSLRWGEAMRSRNDVPAGARDVDFVLPELVVLRAQLIDADTRAAR